MSEFEIFRVDHLIVSESRFEVFFTINTKAVIFTEHFPDFPVVPGACIVGFVLSVLRKWISQYLVYFYFNVSLFSSQLPQALNCIL